MRKVRDFVDEHADGLAVAGSLALGVGLMIWGIHSSIRWQDEHAFPLNPGTDGLRWEEGGADNIVGNIAMKCLGEFGKQFAWLSPEDIVSFMISIPHNK